MAKSISKRQDEELLNLIDAAKNRNNLTDAQLIKKLNISRSTFYDWKKEPVKFPTGVVRLLGIMAGKRIVFVDEDAGILILPPNALR